MFGILTLRNPCDFAVILVQQGKKGEKQYTYDISLPTSCNTPIVLLPSHQRKPQFMKKFSISVYYSLCTQLRLFDFYQVIWRY